MMNKTFTFEALPQSAEALRKLPEASLDDPYKTAALTILALAAYEKNPEASLEMLNFLKGPEPLSVYEKQFLKDRLRGKEYKLRSFFSGAKPENNYTPNVPYEIVLKESPTSFQNEHCAILYVFCGGADSPRPLKFREKPSTGQWFLNAIECLSDIRLPVAEDKWA